MAAELAGILVPGAIDFDEAEAAGLPATASPYIITMEQAFTLALINSRVYQFQLENIYLASLAVTLQRFAFTPAVLRRALAADTAVAAGGGHRAPAAASPSNPPTPSSTGPARPGARSRR